ncbi:MAG: hypothetical protein MJA83_04020, partial [Gammaproteobacteria bacterium]|nr:hypothetical protein [Gammaproteobacteria bacterium]
QAITQFKIAAANHPEDPNIDVLRAYSIRKQAQSEKDSEKIQTMDAEAALLIEDAYKRGADKTLMIKLDADLKNRK